MLSLAPHDRVLVIGHAASQHFNDWAAALTSGALVVLGSAAETRAARREFAAQDNIMFVTGDVSEIPWRNAYFSVIIAPPELAASPALARVLAPEGAIHLTPA